MFVSRSRTREWFVKSVDLLERCSVHLFLTHRTALKMLRYDRRLTQPSVPLGQVNEYWHAWLGMGVIPYGSWRVCSSDGLRWTAVDMAACVVWQVTASCCSKTSCQSRRWLRRARLMRASCTGVSRAQLWRTSRYVTCQSVIYYDERQHDIAIKIWRSWHDYYNHGLYRLISRDVVLDDCPRPRGQLENK